MDEEILNRFNRLEKLLTERNIQEKEFLNVDEACQYLGIKKSTLYKLTHTRKIPYFCPEGKLIFFQKADLNEFLMRNRQHNEDEIKMRTEKLLRK
ncbi:MAG: helix-turn-helix domain-containing protein [Saprospiraceae bacterium]|nr:helix-turn-helix domain-containing protein [Saprospiraceae bacterium]